MIVDQDVHVATPNIKQTTISVFFLQYYDGTRQVIFGVNEEKGIC